jgi:hypothetical protein
LLVQSKLQNIANAEKVEGLVDFFSAATQLRQPAVQRARADFEGLPFAQRCGKPKIAIAIIFRDDNVFFSFHFRRSIFIRALCASTILFLGTKDIFRAGFQMIFWIWRK